MAERTHLFEYGIVAVLIYQALSERAGNGRRVRAPALLALVATILLGWLDEGLQALIPNRVYDNFDVVAEQRGGPDRDLGKRDGRVGEQAVGTGTQGHGAVGKIHSPRFLWHLRYERNFPNGGRTGQLTKANGRSLSLANRRGELKRPVRRRRHL